MTPRGKITLKMLLDHQQNMQIVLRNEILGLDKKFDRKFDFLNRRIDRLEFNLNLQMNGLDDRLTEIEIEKLPQRVKKLEHTARR